MKKAIFKHFEKYPRSAVYVYGIFISFIIIFTLAMIKDFYVENYKDAWLELISLLATIIGLIYFRKNRDVLQGSIVTTSITFFSILSLLVSNEFGHYTIVYSVVAPIAIFFLFEYKVALRITIIFYTLVALLIVYGYYSFENSYFVHDFDSIFNIFITSLIVMAFGFFYHLSHKKSYEALERTSEHNRLLLQEVHHRVKNNLNVVGSILALQARREEGDSKSSLLNSKNRIDAIALTHEMIYKQDDFADILFSDYMKKLSTLVRGTFSDNEVSIIIEAGDLSLRLDTMLQLALITNELLTNSFKHAFKDQCAEIEISLALDKGKYRYFYKDNGVGFKDDFDIQDLDSLGFKLIDLSTRQLNGSNSFEGDGNFKFELLF